MDNPFFLLAGTGSGVKYMRTLKAVNVLTKAHPKIPFSCYSYLTGRSLYSNGKTEDDRNILGAKTILGVKHDD